jgi:hypothetical protein
MFLSIRFNLQQLSRSVTGQSYRWVMDTNCTDQLAQMGKYLFIYSINFNADRQFRIKYSTYSHMLII